MSDPSCPISGNGPSKLLFIRLMVLRLGKFLRESKSIVPLSPMFSSFRPQILPWLQRTPSQLDCSSAVHGEVEAFQVGNRAELFCKKSLNFRRDSESDEEEEEEEEAKTIMKKKRRKRRLNGFVLKIIMV